MVDGFFLWTLLKFGAAIVRFRRVPNFPEKRENWGVKLGGITPEPII